jgi:tetratricopeptide (TPR) repeat protein
VESAQKYSAFISYSHADAAAAERLFRRLETYRVPRRLVGSVGANGIIEARLGKFFRDREELAVADDLGVVVRNALAESGALIVICSPAAAQSRWVNAEIEVFKALGRRDRVFGFIVAGVPGTEVGPERCFPPSLITRDAGGEIHEPMAADARPTRDGWNRAFTKLVAGLLGVHYDLLVRREAQRRLRRVTVIAVASLVGMVGALGLAVAAYVARYDAARRQAQAEDILGFMVDDLRAKLAGVGRLDLMRTVDDKATAYYARLDSRDLSDRVLEQQARLLTGIGQVRTEEGQHAAALAAFEEAHSRSSTLAARDPHNGQRLFDLAQAEYWIGWVAFQQARYDDADQWLRKYRDSAVRLAAMDRNNFAWQKEVAYGDQNLAILDEKRGRYADAERGIREQLALYHQWLAERPDDRPLRSEWANAASWLSTLSLQQGKLQQAEEYGMQVVDGLQQNIAAEPTNMEWLGDIASAYLVLAEAQAQRGRQAEAGASVSKAHAAAAALTTHDPANNEWRVALGNAFWWQAKLARSPSEAAERARAAIQLLESARSGQPMREFIVRCLARARNTAAQFALGSGDISAGKAYLAASLADLNALWSRAPGEEPRILLAQTWIICGDAALREHDMDSARTDWLRARDLLLESSAANAPLPFLRLEYLVAALERLHDVAAAEPYKHRLESAGFKRQSGFTIDAARDTVFRAASLK